MHVPNVVNGGREMWRKKKELQGRHLTDSKTSQIKFWAGNSRLSVRELGQCLLSNQVARFFIYLFIFFMSLMPE